MVLGIFALHGFVLSLIIYFNPRGLKLSNRLLGILLFVFSIILLEESFESLDYHTVYPRITGVSFLMDVLLGPLTLLYALTIVKKIDQLNVKMIAHLAFPIVLNVIYIPYHFWVSWDTHLINNEGLNSLFNGIIIIKIVYQFAYQLSAIITLSIYLKASDKKTLPPAHYNICVWLRNVLTVVIILIPIVLLFDQMQDTFKVDSDYITSLIMLFSIYSIGYAALNNPLVYERSAENTNHIIANGTEKNGPKYRTSPLTDFKKKTYLDQLLYLMEHEKPYLNPDLTSADLAIKMGISNHQLSQILNEVLNQNFYDFINSYRVKSIISKIESQQHIHTNILTLGLESGFNSKATLNRAFKKATGTTPINYIKKAES